MVIGVSWMFKCFVCEALVVEIWRDLELRRNVCVDCMDWRQENVE